MMTLPSSEFGASLELITVRRSLGHTTSQNSALIALRSGIGPPAVGPDMNAFNGIRAGRRAKSYIV